MRLAGHHSLWFHAWCPQCWVGVVGVWWTLLLMAVEVMKRSNWKAQALYYVWCLLVWLWKYQLSALFELAVRHTWLKLQW
jgi:hypothetical protein